jgi:hypothetical protein
MATVILRFIKLYISENDFSKKSKVEGRIAF